jgi:hypothetical protein
LIPGFKRLLDKRAAFLLAEAPGVIAAIAPAADHAAETDARDVEAGAAKFRISIVAAPIVYWRICALLISRVRTIFPCRQH